MVLLGRLGLYGYGDAAFAGRPSFSRNSVERAILVGSILPRQRRHDVDEYLDELALLADTAGAEVVRRVVQDRKAIDPAYFVGKGKAKEISEQAKKLDLDLVIFDDDLTPAQIRNLESMTDVKVIDRSGLILDIFSRRAKSREAKTQVELAQLEYLLPRLTRRWQHLSRQEGGIGTRGPGETQLEVDRRLVAKRISTLKAELQKISQQRDTRRRNRSDIYKVAMVGYTNTGKSTLLNTLTSADVATENRLFVTLDSTIRGLSLSPQLRVLLIDTVGFIRKLPHHLVASFRSTLEEAVSSDLLLHVVDISHPMFQDQIESVNLVLADLKIIDKPAITVFNKIDLLKNRNLVDRLRDKYDPAVFVSATRGYMLSDLLDSIRKVYEHEVIDTNLEVRSHVSEVLAEVGSLGTILDTDVQNGRFHLKFRISRVNLRKLENRLRKFPVPELKMD
jgi:GTP-binding protein HflX